jgi:hypothetical protein
LLTVEKRNAVFVDTALQYYKALKKTWQENKVE